MDAVAGWRRTAEYIADMATEQHAHELKQQGAIEAARDPNSSVTANDAEHTMLAEAHQGGSAAMQFDPDASLAEKRAQARSVRGRHS